MKVNDKSAFRYFTLFKHLDANSKKKLITELRESIGSKHSDKRPLKNLYGAWEDDRSTEEIIFEIRNSRTENRDVEGFE